MTPPPPEGEGNNPNTPGVEPPEGQLPPEGTPPALIPNQMLPISEPEKKSGKSVMDQAALQEQIGAALPDTPTTIEIGGAIDVTQTVEIPTGLKIILIDNGSQQEIFSSTNVSLFQVEKGGELTIRTTGGDDRLLLQGGTKPGYKKGSVATVYGTFHLEGGTLRGGTLDGDNCGIIWVEDTGSCTMTGGILENTTFNGMMSAPVAAIRGGSFAMSGGSIRNNTSNAGGAAASSGILATGWNKNDPPGVVTLSGTAEITGNKGFWGAGVFLIGNAELWMSGGTISGNEAENVGGGVALAGNIAMAGGEAKCIFEMTGGTISNNSSGDCGGGIYLNSDGVTLKGGVIEGNTAARHGGGIYVSVPPYTLHLYDALITGNTATSENGMGGGLWFCPTGDATLSVTNGASVFGNTSQGAGDDFVSVGGKNQEITLAERFLGGGSVTWYQDGKVSAQEGGSDNQVGTVDKDAPRYNPANPGQPVHLENSSGSYALKAVASQEAKDLAENQARLFIRGNSAPHGGGIGSNGSVVIGHAQEEWSLKVTKAWKDVAESKRKPVVVSLQIGGYKLDSVTLDSSNGWTEEFHGIPAPDSLLGNVKITAVEEGKEYDVAYSTVTEDAGTKTLFLTITNSLPDRPGPGPDPDPDPDPEEPEKPVPPPPTTPETPLPPDYYGIPDGGIPLDRPPYTGDGVDIGLGLALLAFCGCAARLTSPRFKRK